LKQFEFRSFNENSNSMIYQNLLSQLISCKIRLPEQETIIDGKIDKESDLVKELLSLQAYQRGKYIVTVEAPDRKGAHDDLSDAFARAVLVATEYKSKGFSLKLVAGPGNGQAHTYRLMRTAEARRADLGRPSRGRSVGNMGRGYHTSALPSYSFTRR